MITKKRLLSGLKEILYVEESMVTLFANFDTVLVKFAEGINVDTKNEIKKLLSVLYRDSARHKETIDGMIDRINASQKNEY